MGWILLGILLLMVTTGAGRAFVRADAATVARWLRLAGAVGAGVYGMFLLVRGQFLIAIPLLTAGVAMLGAAGAIPRRGRGEGRTSVVETASVRMTLDHATGQMDGEVRRGERSGAQLSQLSRAEIDALIAAADADDPDGAALLRTYHQRRFRSRGQSKGGSSTRATPTGEMSAGEAYAVLGLEPGAQEAAIRDAHRRLMKQAHPDRGGSAWLAAKINRAKEVLLPRS